MSQDTRIMLPNAEKGEDAGKNMDGKPLVTIGSDLLQGVLVALEARLGRAAISVGELCKLKVGSVVPLDVQLNEPATLYLNDLPVARGQIVAVDDHFAVRITEIAGVAAP